MSLFSVENRHRPNPCLKCGVVLLPFQIPSLSGAPSPWIQAPEICEACVLKKDRQIKAQKAQEHIDRVFQHVLKSPRFQKRTFETFQPSPSNQKAFDQALGFKIDGSGESLLLSGPWGIGKTHLSAAIANRFLNQHTLLYISCPELLNQLRQEMLEASSDKLNLVRSVELLVLDDLGVEKPSDWVKEILFLIINHRYEYERASVFTTDCDLEELERRLGSRILSRLIGMCCLVRFKDRDFRIQINQNRLPEKNDF